jgi:hypothetical protein
MQVMELRPLVIWLAVQALFVAAQPVFAQATAPPPAVDAAPTVSPGLVAPPAASIEPNAAANASIAAPVAGVRPKVLVLPVDVTVYQLSAAGPEAIPEWTTAARTNLSEGLGIVMANHAGLDYTALPEMSAEERQVLDDYVAVAKLVNLQGQALKARDWETRRAEFDRHLGDGLAFLRQRTGADYAVLVHGAQVEQSGGLIATQLLAAAAGIVLVAGGGTHVSATVLDLSSGDVKWFNTANGAEIFGVGTLDMRKPESTAKVLEKLFEPYPSIPALEPK